MNMKWRMEMTANTMRASATFFGLLFCTLAFPANAAAQHRGPNDFLERRMTPCDFLDRSTAQFEHGRARNQNELRYLTALRKHVLTKSYSVQKECAYDFMRLRRKVVQAATTSTAEFDQLADLKVHPAAYVGRPMIVYGRVTGLRPTDDGQTYLAQLLEIGSNELVANVDVVDARQSPRQIPAEGYPVRVVGFLVKTLEGNVPYFCAQKLEWLSAESDPATFNVIRHKTRGIRPEEASTYYETLMRARILPLTQQQNHADQFLVKRINDRFKLAQEVHGQEREQAESLRRSDLTKAADLTRIADAKLAAEQKRHTAYAADPSGFPVFADVFLNPNEYLGKPVTMRGHVRKVMSYPADVDRFGSGTLHELWLFTDDSQQNPAVVVCSELPANFPTGNEVVEGITVTGYFFKLYRYAADDANRAAPMLLANQVQWQPTNSTYAGFGSLGTLATVLAMFVGAALLMYMWSNHEGDKRAREALAMARTADSGPTEKPVRFPSPDLLPPRTTNTALREREPVQQQPTRSTQQTTETRQPIVPRDETGSSTRQRQILPPPATGSAPVRTSRTTQRTPTPLADQYSRDTTQPPIDGIASTTGRTAPLDPLYRPKETAERAADRVGDFVDNQTGRASDFVARQRDKAGDYVDQQKERVSGFVDQQKSKLSRAADSVPFIPIPGMGQSRTEDTRLPETRHDEPRQPEPRREGRGQSRVPADHGRTVQVSDVVGSQILRVLQQEASDSGSRIELSNGSTLTLSNDVVGIDNRVQRGARSDREFSALEGLQIEQIATDQWERVYLIAGRDTFITEDFAENGQRCLISGSLSALISEEPDLTLRDYWTRTTLR